MSTEAELLACTAVLAAIGRLAEPGLLERPASANDDVASGSQDLLIKAGWLTREPFGPAERLRSALPQGVPVSAAGGWAREYLASMLR
jgi:hypothetical protein